MLYKLGLITIKKKITVFYIDILNKKQNKIFYYQFEFNLNLSF